MDSLSIPSLPQPPSFTTAGLRDSLVQGLRATDVSGTVGLKHEFGLLAAYVDSSGSLATHVFSTEGDVTIATLGLPLNLSYRYSNFRNPLGVNNYFRASLDLDKFRQEKLANKAQAMAELDTKLGDLQKNKDALTGKLGFTEVILRRLEQEVTDREQALLAKQAELGDHVRQYSDSVSSVADTSGLRKRAAAGFNESRTDSLRRVLTDMQAAIGHYKMLYDSVQRIYAQVHDLYATYSDLERELGKRKEQIGQYAGANLNGGAGWMSYLQKLDLGLTYPQMTGLSKNSIPVKGVDMEFQKGNWYTAFAAGVTMNNLMVTNDLVQNKLMNSKNAFNLFDFQEVRQKQLIVQAKSGWGQKEGTHAYLGVRYTNKATFAESATAIPDTVPVAPSVGMELDLRYVPTFSPSTKADLVYGKTSKASSTEPTSRSPLGSLFSDDRTHSALFRVTQTLTKWRSEVSASLRWLDPFTDTRSLGVLQPNNLRYEIRTTHAVTNRLRVGFDYRRDRSNVDNALDTTLRLELLGGRFNGEIGRVVTYYGSFNHVLQSTDRETGLSDEGVSYIVAAGITGQHAFFDFKNAASLLFNDYRIADTAGASLFRNVAFQYMMRYENKQNTLSIASFTMRMPGQSLSRSLIIGNDFHIKQETSELTVGLKISDSDAFGDDMGAKIEYKRLFFDKLQLGVRGEKLVLGSYYNTYDIDRFERFPYAFSTTLQYIIR